MKREKRDFFFGDAAAVPERRVGFFSNFEAGSFLILAAEAAGGFLGDGRLLLEPEEADFCREFLAISLFNLHLCKIYQVEHVCGFGPTDVHYEIGVLL